jgi:hypothetical protein
MKLIIAGTREFNLDLGTIQDLLDYTLFKDDLFPDEIVCGNCRGIDRSGRNWAEFQNVDIKVFKPDWDKYGKAAGPIRNKEMAEYGDRLLLIWDGKSKGSSNMKKEMEKLNKPIYEVIIKG